MKRAINIFFLFTLLLIVFLFAGLNSQPVILNLYFVEYSLPLSLFILFTFICGVLAASLGFLPKLFVRNFKTKRLEKKLQITNS